jgi:hypothetical protein
MFMKISHEVPRCLLGWSIDKMHYQYALPHLLESDEVYRNHFLECKKYNIDIYLDNSIHELGHAVSNELLLKWIEILEPKYVFVPDVWEDTNKSIENAFEWSKTTLSSPTQKIAVVQSTSLLMSKICYREYKRMGYEKIAFSYGANYYLDHSNHPNKDIRRALGRVEVISSLYKDSVIRDTDNIHLLGTSWPLEFSFYKEMPFIKSIDTSNPIMAAIENVSYTDLGINSKPKKNLNDSFNIPLEKINISILENNINKFKNITLL